MRDSSKDKLRSKCAQGRAAWLERGRKCSVQEETASTHNRYKPWIQRNRVQDVSLAGSSDDDDIISVIRGPSTFANAFLYIGFGTIALGLVIAFVGTGEKGFKTTELRLIGPIMIVVGFVFMVLRIFFCICPSSCIRRNKDERKRKKNEKDKNDADHRTSLLRDKRVSIARTPMGPHSSQPKLSRSNTKSIVKTKTYEGVEALRQIATTSLFLQNETETTPVAENSSSSSNTRNKTSNNKNISKLATSLVVPTIKEPDKQEVDVELKRINSIDIDTLNVIDNTATSPIDPHPFDPNDDYGNESYSDEDEEEQDDNDSKKLIESDNETSNSKKVSVSASNSRTSSIKHSDSVHHRRSGSSKLSRQRLSINNQKVSPSTTTTSGALIPSPTPSQLSTDSGKVMETSLMVLPVSVVSTATTTCATPSASSTHVLTHQTSSTSSTTSVSSSPSTVISIPQLMQGATSSASTKPPPPPSYVPCSSKATTTSKFTFNLLSPPPPAASSSSKSSSSGSHFDFSRATTTLLQPLTSATASGTTTASSTSSRSNGSTHTRQVAASTSSSTSTADTSEIVLSPAKLGQQ
ncbi:uncharacterized protein LOC134828605 [Culicoides brevitarsis]|uniref:uncharacterized protein LOC134828605 n=1 Tax=Culicoides brevitarsis TaxID=469753 RepID=UPI00307C85BE